MNNKEQILNDLETNIIGKNIIYLDTVESTNDYAKQLAEELGPEGTVVIANEQTKGKGRIGRSWFSIKDKGAYLSVIAKPYKSSFEITAFTLLLASIIKNWLNRYAEIEAQVKAPNDVLVDGRKLAGILVERVESPNSLPKIIIGIGINVNHDYQDFPLELRDQATSLKIITKEEFNLIEVLRTLIQALDTGYKSYLS